MMEAKKKDQVVDAWKRIGLTDDGKIARKLLVARLLEVRVTGSDLGAATFDQGERNFCGKLLELMDADVPDGSKPDDTDARRRKREPVKFGRQRQR